jgi:hypothetical protein
MIRFACPGCAVTLECPEERLGSVIRCPNCKQELQLPAAAPAIRRPKAAVMSRSSPSSSLPPLPAPSSRRIAAPSVQRSSSRLAWLVVGLLLFLLVGSAGGAVWWFKSQQDPIPDSPVKTDTTTSGTSTPSSAAAAADTEPPEWIPTAPSSPLSEPRIEEQVVVNASGDAWITRGLQLPLMTYTAQKENTTNIALLERNLRMKQTWRQVEALKVQFDDRSSTLVVRWRVRGFARPQAAESWIVSVPPGLSMVHSSGNEAVLSGKTTSDLNGALVMLTSRIKLPAGAKNAALRGPASLAYECPAPIPTTSDDAAPKFDLEVRPHLLACIGQLYAKPHSFEQYWVARAVLRNTGKSTLQNYRVRFRLEGYMPAADEHRCAVVVPGQSVVDASFPVLDLEKLAALTTPVMGTLVAEYEYELPDGRAVRENVSRSLQILSRNMILRTDLRPEEVVSYHDQRRIYHHVMAAIVTQKDTAIMTLNGWVNGWAAELAGRPIAAGDRPEDAMIYMRMLHAFMRDTISYTTPPGESFDGKPSQHVKYGRDVLEHKAGTCIDLAILFASVCEAAGLKPVLINPPGHVFLAIRLPKTDDLIAVETTMLGPEDTFDDALAEGMKKLDALRPGQFITSDVAALRKQGVQSLPLPEKKLEDMRFVQKMPPVLLRQKTRDGKVVLVSVGGSASGTSAGGASSGSGPTSGGAAGGGSSSSGSSTGGRSMFSSPPEAATPVSVVGRWQASGYEGRYFAKSDLALAKDGKYTYNKVLYNNMGVAVNQVNQKGTYKTSRESIAFKNSTGDEEVCPYQMRGESLYLTIKTPIGTTYPQYRKVPE